MTARDRALTERMAELMGWTLIKGNIWRTADGTKVIVGPTGLHPLGEYEREAIADAHECLEAWFRAAPGRLYQMVGFANQISPHKGERMYQCFLSQDNKPVGSCPSGDADYEPRLNRCRAIVEALAAALGFEFEEVKS